MSRLLASRRPICTSASRISRWTISRRCGSAAGCSPARRSHFDGRRAGWIRPKAEIHQLIARLVADGAAVLMISSEMPEILGRATASW